MAIRYVRADGNDGNAGTGTGTGAAWQSINYALTQIGPGDVLRLVAGGGVFDERVSSASIPNGTDTTIGSGAIHITVNPGDYPVIRPSGGAGACIEFNNKSYIICDNITFDAINDSSSQPVVGINGGDHIQIRDCEIMNGYWSGIFVGQSSGFPTDIEILDNLIHDGGRAGVLFSGAHGIYVSGNTATTLGLDAHSRIEGNFIYGFNVKSNDSGIQLYEDSSNQDCLGGWTITRNSISGNGVGTFLGNAQTVPIVFTQNVVRDNLGSGIVLFQYLADPVVAHNTVDGNGGWGIEVGNNWIVTGALLKNNGVTNNTSGCVIIRGTPSGASPDSYAILVNNGFYGNTGWGDVIADQTGLNTESGTITSNPLYVSPASNNFHITETSPWFDAGVDLGLTYDRDGNPRDSGVSPDIGAYEVQVAAAEEGTFWAPGFWATGFWADGFWTGDAAVLHITTSIIANGREGTAYTQTLVATNGTEPYAWTVTAGALPDGLTLHAGTGVIDGTPTVPGPFTFTVTVTDDVAATDTQAYTVEIIPVLAVTTTTLDDGDDGVAYSELIEATGGVEPYTWSVFSGSLPDGVSLNTSTGALTGTPTEPGTFAFTIRVTDFGAFTDNQALSIDIAAATLAITTLTLPTPFLDSPYSATVSATGGILPYTFTVSVGSLPTGLSLNASSGAITGTPTVDNTFNFTILVTDDASVTDSQAYSLDVVDGIPFTLDLNTRMLLYLQLVYTAPTQGDLTTLMVRYFNDQVAAGDMNDRYQKLIHDATAAMATP